MKNKYKHQKNLYINIFPAKVQNRFLAESLVKLNGPKLIDLLNTLDVTEAKKLMSKFPDVKNRIVNRELKKKLYPDLLHIMLKHPIITFGLLSEVEQAKYLKDIKSNLPWNKRKKEENIKTKTIKKDGERELKFKVNACTSELKDLYDRGLKFYNPDKKIYYTYNDIKNIFKEDCFNPSNINAGVTATRILNSIDPRYLTLVIFNVCPVNIKIIKSIENKEYKNSIKIYKDRIEFSPRITQNSLLDNLKLLRNCHF